MNISCKGLHRFCNPKGDTCEAMRGNLEEPVILRVDVSKLVTDWGDACIV